MTILALVKMCVYNLSRVFWLFPLKKSKIFLMNFDGTLVGHDAKAFVEWCNDHGQRFDFVWGSKNAEYAARMSLENTRFVVVKSLRGMYEIMTAQTLLYNINPPSYLCFRKRQTLINTWHGFPTKFSGKYIPGYNRKQFNTTTCFLADAEICARLTIRDAFGYEGDILKIGTPKTDCFYSEKSEELKERVRKAFAIDARFRIALYAPTFRGDFIYTPSKFDFESLRSALSGRFGGEWVVLCRLHPMIAKSYKMSAEGVIDVSLYDDTQELLCATDVLITDYSSIKWDFSLQFRPVFIYAEDAEQFSHGRGLTVPLQEWPFSVASDNKELAANIMSFDEREYADKVARFHQKMGNYDLGYCCHNLNQYILNHGGIAQ